ncbi:MAG TPA: PEP/pyruvate-binding domain-containing protein [Kofleriaceae bacterium]
MHDLVDLRDANAGFGNKAAGLARLIAAGLPVPPGFAIAERVFEQVVGPLDLKDLDAAGHVLDAAARRIDEAEVPTEIAAALREHLRELGRAVIVRSSSAIEDGAHGGGAGVFESVGPVPSDVEHVWGALRAVWTSALAPAAIAYARGRRHAIGLGAIVQQHVAGERVTVYTRSPAHADEIAIQRGDTLVRAPRTAMPAELADHHAVTQALRAERVLGVAADVELVQSRARPEVIETWVVQARPIVVAPPRPVMTEPPPIVLAPLHDGRVWTWDVTHNPDPLSPAQRGLVELVERERLGAYELRVAAGYLYTAARDGNHGHHRHELSATLVARCRELEAEAERILADRTSSPPLQLEAALETYGRFYKLWANELSPRIAELRVRVRDGDTPNHRPSSVEAAIAACARGAIDFAQLVQRIGAVSPTWDIAVPPFGERTELLQQAVALVRLGVWSPSATELESRSENIDLAAIAADLAERDDLLFARAQQRVRIALRARGAELAIGDDIFWVDLELARSADPDPIALQRKAAAARAAHARTAAWQMPLVVGGPMPAAEPRREMLHGVGSGPRVTGRVVRFASLASAVLAMPGDVIVVRAVTPALAVFVGRCAALVSETGGLLDHGAALARELGITCVVGCRDAWTSLHDDDTVDVDGDAGTVTRR